MTKIKLKRLLSKRKKKTAIILHNLAEADNVTFAIKDVEGQVLLGTAGDANLDQISDYTRRNGSPTPNKPPR